MQELNVDDCVIAVKEGDTLELGKHTLHFVMAPMVHWPEVMVTYDALDKVLFAADGFGKQLKNNFAQYIGLSLNIPIFNRFTTRNSVRMARLDRDNQALQLDLVKKRLYKEIQQVYYNAVAAQAKYESSQLACQSSSDAFTLTQAKYENGKATITEFNETKSQLLKAESDLVQARYEHLYQTALLDFYRGKPLQF